MNVPLSTVVGLSAGNLIAGLVISYLYHAKELTGYRYVVDHLSSSIAELKTEISLHVKGIEQMVVKDVTIVRADLLALINKIKAKL